MDQSDFLNHFYIPPVQEGNCLLSLKSVVNYKTYQHFTLHSTPEAI